MSEDKTKPENDKKSSGENELANSLVDNVEGAFVPPEVDEEIAKNANEINNPQIDPENVDADGIVFDPDLHATDKAGNPSKTKTGKFRKKKGVSSVAAKDAKKIDEAIKDANAVRMTANAASAMLIQSGCMFFGDEWLPQTQPHDEKAMLDNAFHDYFQAKEIKDFPAGVALSIAIFAYAAPRFTQPKTRSRFEQIKDKVTASYLNWRSKRGKKNGAHTGTRKNGKREDNANQEASEASKS